MVASGAGVFVKRVVFSHVAAPEDEAHSAKQAQITAEIKKHWLRGANLRLCSGNGLAGAGFVGNRGGDGWVAVVGQISPPQIQFSTGQSLWLLCRPFLGSPKLDCVSRAQRGAA